MLGPAESINREAVDSSNLVSIGYSEERQVCAVEFKSGALFHFSGVSLEVFTAFYLAPSRGSFFAKNIKGKFSGRKMTGPCDRCAANGIIGERCVCGGTHQEADKRYGEPPTGLETTVEL